MREGRPFLSCLVASLWSFGGVTVACGVGIGELLANCPERGAGDASYEPKRQRVVGGAMGLTAEKARCIRRNARVLRGRVSRGDSLPDRGPHKW
jgi:hypothetical protein